MRKMLLVVLLVIPGFMVAGVTGYYALIDYTQLQVAYKHFHSVASAGSDLKTIFTAYSMQDIHRTNLFADGTWAMLGAILAGMGITGLCLIPKKN